MPQKSSASNIIRCSRSTCQNELTCGIIPSHFGISRKKPNNPCLKLDELFDVSVKKSENGQYLCYTGGIWINSYINLDNLNDTTINNPKQGEYLCYDGNSQQWINSTIDLNDLNDATINNPNQGEYLGYDIISQQWINSTIDLNDLNDATINNPNQGEYLGYDNISQQWINSTIDLNDLEGTTISNPNQGEYLGYDNISQQWINTPIDLNDLNDATINNPNQGEYLCYNGSSQQWINSTISLNNLNDATINNPNQGEYLCYNGSSQQWINTPISLNNLNDATINNPNQGEYLCYNGSSQQWINSTISLNNLNDVTITDTSSPLSVLRYSNNSWSDHKIQDESNMVNYFQRRIAQWNGYDLSIGPTIARSFENVNLRYLPVESQGVTFGDSNQFETILILNGHIFFDNMAFFDIIFQVKNFSSEDALGFNGTTISFASFDVTTLRHVDDTMTPPTLEISPFLSLNVKNKSFLATQIQNDLFNAVDQTFIAISSIGGIGGVVKFIGADPDSSTVINLSNKYNLTIIPSLSISIDNTKLFLIWDVETPIPNWYSFSGEFLGTCQINPAYFNN